MQMSRGVPSSVVSVSNIKPLIGALTAALLMCSTSYAASFGHSRLVSALGQPLHINVPVSQLSADDLRSFSAVPAPASAWAQAGLVPPVDLASLQLQLVDGFAPGSKLIQVRSDHSFNKPVADLLLDVRTATGQQRYQVSLLTRAPSGAVTIPQADVPQTTIRVRRGDTMFAIAKRHAVPGVSVYQMMIALQRANPQAFIHDNLNLVKAGANLSMPDKDALTAISDREARRLFQQQALAFAKYRQGAAVSTGAVEQGSAAAGVVTAGSHPPSQDQAATPQDQLRLSGAQTGSGGTAAGSAGVAGSGDASARADDATATRKGIVDSEQRVSQLEENVKTLNEALRSQGGAASDLVIGTAKDLSQSIAEVTGAIASTDSNANGTSAAAQTQDGANAPNAPGQATAGSQSGASASSAADSTASTSGASSTNGNSTTQGTAGANGGSTAHGASGASGGNAATGAAAGSAATAGGQGNQNAASSDAEEAAQTAESISTKAEQSVSWFQEHMLGVITGLLAFIVLIIAWLLRRANAARDEGREGNTGPITEAMVQEKLEQISLDLEQQPPAGSRHDTR